MSIRELLAILAALVACVAIAGIISFTNVASYNSDVEISRITHVAE